jgi:hypothetical protein
MTVLNALDRPYKRQADVMITLQRDGAVMFVVLEFFFVILFFWLIFLKFLFRESCEISPAVA